MRSSSLCGFRLAAGLSLLTSLAAAPAVHAQGLTLGTPLAASAPSSGSAVVSATGTTLSGTAAFDGGAGTSTANYGSVNEYDASTITLQKGSSVTNLTAYDNSQITVNGGSVGNLTTAFQSSNTAGFSITGGTVGSIKQGSSGYGSISGGTVGNVTFDGYSNNSSVSASANPLNIGISGGTVGNVSVTEFFLGGNSLITGGDVKSFTENGGDVSLSGGNLGSLTLGTEPEGSTGVVTTTNATISGGHVTTLNTFGGATPFPFTSLYQISDCTIRGGTFDTLMASYHGGYDIYGSGLQLTSAGYVTGTLSDGEAIDALFTNTDPIGNTGFLHLHNGAPAVPEASTTVSFGLLLMLGLGGAFVARRKNAAK